MKSCLGNRMLRFILLLFLTISLPALADQHKHSNHKKTHTSNHNVLKRNKLAHENKHKPLKLIGGAEAFFVVQPGDVFGKVAQKYQPAGISLKDVMKAIYAINRHAFVNGDQKRLIVGAKLRIPLTLTKVTDMSVEVNSQPKPSLSDAVQLKDALKSTTEPQKLPIKSDASSLLEDDPKNPKSQAKTIETNTVDSAKKTSQANPNAGSNFDSPPTVVVGQIPPDPVTQTEPQPQRHRTGLNGFVLVGLCLFVLALIIFWRLRSMKIQQAQRELVEKMMSQNNS